MNRARRWRTALGVFVVSALGFGACVERVDVGTLPATASGSGGTAGSGSGLGGAGSAGIAGSVVEAGAGGAIASCEPTDCLGKRYACGNCDDDDGDGLADSVDPECLGPCDDSEDSFSSRIPGANNAPCRQDCYFDGDTGSGNDDCAWSHTCDPGSVAPLYPPSGDARCEYAPDASVPGSAATCTELGSAQTEACTAYCGPLVPNGCDCFGCCELPAGSGRTVWIGSERDGQGSCTPATLDDPESCRPCTPVPSCQNACDPCEDCAGRVGPAPGCAGGEPQCGAGITPCGRPGQASCPAGIYCVTGCCVAVPL